MGNKGAKRKAREAATAQLVAGFNFTNPRNAFEQKYHEVLIMDNYLKISQMRKYKNKQELSAAATANDKNKVLECLDNLRNYGFQQKRSTLAYCAKHDLKDVADFIIRNNIEKPVRHDVEIAMLNRNGYFIDLYLKNGVDVKSVDEDGETFVHYWARNSQNVIFLKILERYGAVLDSENKARETPIYKMLYCTSDAFYPKRTYIPALQYIASKTDINHCIGNQTLLDYAIDNDAYFMEDILKEFGAKKYKELHKPQNVR